MTFTPGPPPEKPRSGWPRGRVGWIAGSLLLIVLGVIVGQVLGNVMLGLLLALIVSIGWIIAYESSRGGRDGKLNDPDDDGARL
ncbi:MAG: hypothetical protein QM611_01885 [Microbacterium sp.]|uniref:hypothetical protein n=1 Tax=Microbacterium sp. TaxID=51671 RepID=UPI0039E53990